MMGCVLRVDFEGDQWTFFKPPPEHLERLYGVDIHEMQPYRPLPEQIAEQLAHDRTLIVELDSWYLPDTAATSYRREHVKSSVVAEAIDPDRRASALLPRTRLLRTGGRGLPRRLPPRPTVLRGRAAALHRARAPRRGGLAHRRCVACGGARAARREPRAAATTESFRALRSAAHGRSATPARGRSRRLPRLCVRDRPHGRLGVRGRRLPRRLAARRGGSARHGGDGTDRRRLQGPLVQARAAARVRPGAGDRGAGGRMG